MARETGGRVPETFVVHEILLVPGKVDTRGVTPGPLSAAMVSFRLDGTSPYESIASSHIHVGRDHPSQGGDSRTRPFEGSILQDKPTKRNG